jgi:hypothetical protein
MSFKIFNWQLGRQVRMHSWNEGGFMWEAWCRRGRLVSLGLVLMVVVEVTNAATPAATPESMTQPTEQTERQREGRC